MSEVAGKRSIPLLDADLLVREIYRGVLLGLEAARRDAGRDGCHGFDKEDAVNEEET